MKHLHVFPFVVVVLMPSTMVITYLLAVKNGHVEKMFPYISECAANPPESDLFTQMMNICAAFLVFTIYFRYKCIGKYFSTHCSKHAKEIIWLNKISLFFGQLLALGISMVANFRVTEILEMHMISAALVFGNALVYCALQTRMSFRMCPDINTRMMAYLRLVLVAMMIVFVACISIFGYIAAEQFQGDDEMHWKPEDGGYYPHLVSTFSEWFAVLTLDLAIATAIPDFYRLQQIKQIPDFLRI